MNKVYLLYGEKCGAEELLGIYSHYALAAEVGEAFKLDGHFEDYNIETWSVVDTYADAFGD